MATAGPGSLVSGVVWADTNRDGVRDANEVAQEGVTVELLSSPGGAVVATTTTDADGNYSFADVADGDYTVRVDAPGAFVFPDAAGGDNDFSRPGAPNPGEPERGVSAPFPITGATQVTDLDAGMQPITNLEVRRIPYEPSEGEACDGFAQTGTAPFDADDDPGHDSGPGNCIVRTGDTVSQKYGVSLTDLPTGAEVDNVVAEFTLSSPDGAALELAGPGEDGLPAGCLSAENGADPPSSSTVNPDGSITVTCNLGTMSSNAAAILFNYRFTSDTPIPSHASIEMHAYAGGGDAGDSNTVEGPEVEVTGTARWDLEKIVYPSRGNNHAGPKFTELDDGSEGYLVNYQFNITDTLEGIGATELVWPVTFTDVLPEFPNAQITECRPTDLSDFAGRSPWTLTCPIGDVQGTDGWELSIEPDSGVGGDTGEGHMVMTVFVPLEDMNRAIDPTWQPGDDLPTGTFDFDNRAQDTDHWSINGGALNYGDGQEPGFDGTGNNLATLDGDAEDPQWDLQKTFRGGPSFSIETIDGEEVDGYVVEYNLRIIDLAGPDNIGPWLDRPVTFQDRLVSHPGAILLSCRPHQEDTGTPTCETGAQPADGWDMSFEPNQRGFDFRRGTFVARMFIPMDEIEGDICQSNVTLDLRNEAINSEHWTAQGQPNNGTGFEPGWDGAEATGNNLDERSIRPSASDCGTLNGDKRYIATETGGIYTPDPNAHRPSYAGHTLNARVSLNASSDRVTVDDLRLCDVFDVSTQFIRIGEDPWIVASGSVDPADYVFEYAIGPNEVDTQAGPFDETPGVNLYPSDTTSINDAAADCRTHAGPWTTDPEATFGADWRDSVNMVRMRPIDPNLSETGPFGVQLNVPLEVRGTYNGGPNAGETIPHRIRLANAGGWPTGTGSGDGWATTVRERRYEGPGLAVDKNVSPATYLPGDDVVWDLNVQAVRTVEGMTMFNVQVVDTIPEDLHFDQACTEDLLPDGVTLTYSPANREVTFSGGNVAIVSTGSSQWIFHPTDPNARHLRICMTVDTLAQPGDTYVNTMQAFADNSVDEPTADATIQVVGSGQLGITKSVDKPYVASGEEYSWSLDWGNTSTVITFQPPDVIDVLPWVGDGEEGAGSKRDQYASDYEGLAQLTGPLATPTYIRGGGGGDVPGTWYYATADPSTISHDPRDASNANPAAAGGLWLTQSEVADFGAVTAVRFVSDDSLPTQSRVRAVIPAVSTSNALDNVYVNRAMIFSGTFADQPLLSNEPFVLMPGFTLGDLVWRDDNGDGIFNDGESGIPGVPIEVLDANDNVVGTATTDADGRWSVDQIPDGTYRVRIPGTAFDTGGPLEQHRVSTVGSSSAEDTNESVDNNNTATPDPVATGLVSTPVTLAYIRDDDGNLIGGNGPAGDDVAGLAGELIPDEFTNFTMDLTAVPVPDVDIEKATNTVDADEPTGPLVAVGDPVEWTYVVTNTGATDLTNLTVTDDQIDAAEIDCDGTGGNVVAGPLAPDDSFTCTATGTAVEGQYANTAMVVADAPDETQVDDEDPSHHFGAIPDIDIEKATNTVDADQPTGPLVVVGGSVEWTYVVTNTGNTDLTDVTVTDDQIDAGDIDCDGTGGNVVAGPLAPGGSFECVATGVAAAGQYANLGTVVGDSPDTTDTNGDPVDGVQVTDEDPSHHVGVNPEVDIEKATNTFDADEPTGPFILVGDPVVWTYVVTNTGDVDLTNVVVTDDQLDASEIDCDGTGSNVIAGPLAPDESFTCVATGVAVAGQYANTGTVVADGPETTGPDGELDPPQVTDDDPSHEFGAEPAVDIEKSTNGEDADEPTGPSVPVGGTVEWVFVVTNTGNVDLTNVTVTDDQLDASEIDCGDGTNVVAGPLAPGDTFTCTAQGVAVEGQYANVSSVVGEGPVTVDENGDPVPAPEVGECWEPGDEQPASGEFQLLEDGGTRVCDDDPSHYIAEPVADDGPPEEDEELVSTGRSIVNPLIVGLIILLAGAGLLLMGTHRRRRHMI
jgi:hypothetical protein